MSKDSPYQVFISFKNLNSDGTTSRDHDIAKELYEHLEAEGIRTFFSEVSIPEEGSSSYMKVINNALEQATIMILVGTKKEHILSKWVAQEWESFLGDINSNIKVDGDFLVFVEGMSNRDIPALLRNQQMIDYREGYNAVIDFVRNHLNKTKSSSQNGLIEGLKYIHGPLGTNHFKTAFKLISDAADNGLPEAMYETGCMYRYGLGTAPSYHAAATYFEKAANEGNADAMFALGNMYRSGDWFDQSEAKASEWFDKAFSAYMTRAESGDSDAEYAIGFMYESGIGTKYSTDSSLEWYKKAANQGNEDAMNNCAALSARNNGDPHEAFELFKKAADRNNVSAMYNLGRAYLEGLGAECSEENALVYFKKAAEMGDGFAINVLQRYDAVGLLYTDGFVSNVFQIIKTEPVTPESYGQYIREAENGESWAQYRLSICYEKGWGVKQSDEKSFDYLLKAAKQGNMLAQYWVGEAYEIGKGILVSKEEAKRWYTSACNQGMSDAKIALDYLDQE